MYNSGVPGQRAAGQKVIALALDEELLDAMDQSRALSHQDRSTFIRVALIEYLNQRGTRVDPALAFAPDRAGKGGRPRKGDSPGSPLPARPDRTSDAPEFPIPRSPGFELNEKPEALNSLTPAQKGYVDDIVREGLEKLQNEKSSPPQGPAARRVAKGHKRSARRGLGAKRGGIDDGSDA